MGNKYTAGFLLHRKNYGLVCTCAHGRYGFGRFGYGVGKLYLRYTHGKSYTHLSTFEALDLATVIFPGLSDPSGNYSLTNGFARTFVIILGIDTHHS